MNQREVYVYVLSTTTGFLPFIITDIPPQEMANLKKKMGLIDTPPKMSPPEKIPDSNKPGQRFATCTLYVCVCVCMYVCMYVTYIRTYIDTYIHVCVRARMYTYACLCKHACMHACMSVRVCVCVRLYACISCRHESVYQYKHLRTRR
jgi:hypothetical protein